MNPSAKNGAVPRFYAADCPVDIPFIFSHCSGYRYRYSMAIFSPAQDTAADILWQYFLNMFLREALKKICHRISAAEALKKICHRISAAEALKKICHRISAAETLKKICHRISAAETLKKICHRISAAKTFT